MTEECSECGYPKERSASELCYVCERAGEERGEGDRRYAELQKELKWLHDLRGEESEIWLEQLGELRLEIEGLRDVLCLEGLDEGFLKRLIGFCHPDKNVGREVEAGEITKVLLSLRGR